MEALFQGLGISCDYTEDSPEIEDNSSDIDESLLVEPARSNPVRPGGAVRVQNLQDIWTEREKVKELHVGQVDIEVEHCTTRESNKEQDEEQIKRLKERPYQVELLHKALEGNTIVYLGTGSGKTFIAVMLIKEMRGELVQGPKKAVFLVSSVALVAQQRRLVEEQTGLKVRA